MSMNFLDSWIGNRNGYFSNTNAGERSAQNGNGAIHDMKIGHTIIVLFCIFNRLHSEIRLTILRSNRLIPNYTKTDSIPLTLAHLDKSIKMNALPSPLPISNAIGIHFLMNKYVLVSHHQQFCSSHDSDIELVRNSALHSGYHPILENNLRDSVKPLWRCAHC